jgi:AmmeMemoRadiSam system protein B
VLIVASSDMSHFVSGDAARKLDLMALERVQQLDPAGLYQVVTRHQISMCGVVPTTIALVAALALGATQASMVRYGNSGDALGDYQSVVGYAGVVIR